MSDPIDGPRLRTTPIASRRTFVALGGSVLAAALSGSARDATPSFPAVPTPGVTPPEIRYWTIDVGGLGVFYREAGPAWAPVVLLLHGFPTSSRMFRNLIPMLADKYRVIAPDYPAFGHSALPSRSDFPYTHAHLSVSGGGADREAGDHPFRHVRDGFRRPHRIPAASLGA